jgi:hypothetical protein
VINVNTIENTIEVEKWDDPGDYPNAVAASPLPSHLEAYGTIVVELDETETESGSWENLFSDYLNEEYPHDGYTINWEWKREGRMVTAWVESAEEWDKSDYCD